MTDPISGQAIVYVVDDDEGVRASLRFLLSKVGWQVQTFADIESFQNAFDPNRIG